MIQRDYAQGRQSASEVRQEFLDALHRALTLPPEDSALPLNLDFIYGSVESEGARRFLPLDGQQRLTTLFLLHWYLAWKDGCSGKFGELLAENSNSRFSYVVRRSSTEFYSALVRFQPDEPPDPDDVVSRLVSDQPWYFRSWRLDPTIQSSLGMLDAIHGEFHWPSGLYDRITDSERPAITFQVLELENFGLSDDLYIKMNARGRPLTALETFKARFEQDLESQFEQEVRWIGDESFSVAEFFSRQMDTAWAEFFWTYRSTETNLYDDAVMNLLRVVALASRDPESDSFVEDVAVLRDRRWKSSYSLFHGRGWVDRDFSEELFTLLEAWTEGGTVFTPQLPDARFFDEAALFRKALTDPVGLSFAEIVQFAGYVIFLREHGEARDQAAFQEWMRVVCNLSGNTSYDRAGDMQRSVAGLRKLGGHSGEILQFLAGTENPTTGFSLDQIREEKCKAELILADPNWRGLIDRCEGHGYFKGQIEFLLDFSGVIGRREETGVGSWSEDDHRVLQERFESYAEKAEAMFAERGLRSVGEYRWERALLSIGDYFLPSGRQNVSFLDSSTDQASWKRLLRGTGPQVPEARDLLRRLWDRLEGADCVAGQVDGIIGAREGVEAWREAFITTPQAFAYCGRRAIRRNGSTIYLLRKTQMNGLHAELFTYSLFRKELLRIAGGEGFHPLELCEYYEARGIDVEPGIRLTWSRGERSLTFDVKWTGEHFAIRVGDGLREVPDVRAVLMEEAGFAERGVVLEREASLGNALEVLLHLRQVLSGVCGGGD